MFQYVVVVIFDQYFGCVGVQVMLGGGVWGGVVEELVFFFKVGQCDVGYGCGLCDLVVYFGLIGLQVQLYVVVEGYLCICRFQCGQ